MREESNKERKRESERVKMSQNEWKWDQNVVRK